MSALRLEMDMIQAKVKSLLKRGFSKEEIAKTLNMSKSSVGVMVKYLKKGRIVKNERKRNVGNL
jgi:predicted transcriptional regulator